MTKALNRLLFLITFISILFVTLPACGSGGSLQILTQQLTTRQFTGQTNTSQSMAAVSGTAKNVSNHAVSGCEIKVTFVDEKGNVVGIASTTRDSLGAGEVWYFGVQLTNPDAWKARSYEIAATSQ
ncbi:MAG: FxLYD domain-containing protein [Dehalococcoidia bacterium]|jgi:uncharacterized lipoprotein YehR (DUF1307 family)